MFYKNSHEWIFGIVFFSSCMFYAFFGILSFYVSLASLHTVDIDNQTGTSRKWVFTKKPSCCKLKLLHARQDGSLLHVWSNNHWSYIFFSENTMGDLTFLWPELPRDWKHTNVTETGNNDSATYTPLKNTMIRLRNTIVFISKYFDVNLNIPTSLLTKSG